MRYVATGWVVRHKVEARADHRQNVEDLVDHRLARAIADAYVPTAWLKWQSESV